MFLDKVISKFANCCESKEAKLPSYDMLKGKKYFDWILPALLRHKDCKELRDIGGVEQAGIDFMEEDRSSWEIRTWNKSDILGAKVEEKHDEKEFMKWLEQFDSSFAYSEYSEEISRRLDWEYQYKKPRRYLSRSRLLN